MPIALGLIAPAILEALAAILFWILVAIIIIAIIALIIWVVQKLVEYITTPTIDKVWDEVAPESIPISPSVLISPPVPGIDIPLPPNGLDRIDPKVLDQVLELLAVIALTHELMEGEWNVYDVHVTLNDKPFNNYAPDRFDNNGIVATTVMLPVADIYKYGMTKHDSVRDRFGAAHNPKYDQTKRSNQRDRYIYGCLKEGRLFPTEWYLYHYSFGVAYALENMLIVGYTTSNRMHPAGNMNDH